MDNPNDSEDDWEAENETDTEHDNGSEVSQTLEVRNVSAATNVSGLIRPIRQSKKKVEKVLVMVNIWKRGGIRGSKKSRTECVNVLSPSSLCSLRTTLFSRIITGEC